MATQTKQSSSDRAVSLALLVTAGTLLLASTGRPGRFLLEKAANLLNDQLLKIGHEMAILEQEIDHRSMRER